MPSVLTRWCLGCATHYSAVHRDQTILNFGQQSLAERVQRRPVWGERAVHGFYQRLDRCASSCMLSISSQSCPSHAEVTDHDLLSSYTEVKKERMQRFLSLLATVASDAEVHPSPPFMVRAFNSRWCGCCRSRRWCSVRLLSSACVHATTGKDVNRGGAKAGRASAGQWLLHAQRTDVRCAGRS
jgi:hypothetical protein